MATLPEHKILEQLVMSDTQATLPSAAEEDVPAEFSESDLETFLKEGEIPGFKRPPRQKKSKFKSAGDSMVKEAKAPKLRPAQDVLNRLEWDPSLWESEYIIGYVERFEGVKEISLAVWLKESTEEDFIPQHRIRFVKRESDGVVLWDREKRIDMIFGSGVGGGDAAQDGEIEKKERKDS